MKKLWKWILGIFIVIAIVAVLAAVPFAMHNYAVARGGAFIQPQQPQPGQGWNDSGPMGRGGFHGNYGFDQRSGPMMGGRSNFNRGFGGFVPGLMFLGGLMRLIPAVLFGLLLYGVYSLGKRAGLRAVPAAVPGSIPVEPAPAAPSPAVADVSQNDQTPVI